VSTAAPSLKAEGHAERQQVHVAAAGTDALVFGARRGS
jgi:hypothetical protein